MITVLNTISKRLTSSSTLSYSPSYRQPYRQNSINSGNTSTLPINNIYKNGTQNKRSKWSNCFCLKSIEQITIGMIFIITILWIIITISTILYHTYTGKQLPGILVTNQQVANEQVKKHEPIIVKKDSITSRIKNDIEDTFQSQQQNQQNQQQNQQNQQSHNNQYQLQSYETPLLVFTCKRPEYLQRSLQSIYNFISFIDTDYYHPKSSKIEQQQQQQQNNNIYCTIGCPIIISQDDCCTITDENSNTDETITFTKTKIQQEIITIINIFRYQIQLKYIQQTNISISQQQLQLLQIQSQSQNTNAPDYTNTNTNNDPIIQLLNTLVYHIQHIIPSNKNQHQNQNPYALLSQHYGYSLRYIFNNTIPLLIPTSSTNTYQQTIVPLPKQPQRIIILEEDIEIASDFFHYFYTTAPLLDSSNNANNILAISAFNDNGYQYGQVYNQQRLLKSDFFSGLGWMLSLHTWQSKDWHTKWPTQYWDDWLRLPEQRQNKKFIHPEISRTYHFGSKNGASANQFGTSLSNILLYNESLFTFSSINNRKFDWYTTVHQLNQYNVGSTTTDTNVNQQQNEITIQSTMYNLLQNNTLYNQYYLSLILQSIPIHTIQDVYTTVASASATIDSTQQQKNYRIEYSNDNEFQSIVSNIKPIPLMTDEKVKIYRTAYYGVVETRIVIIDAVNVDNNNNNKLPILPKKEPPILFIIPPIQQLVHDMI